MKTSKLFISSLIAAAAMSTIPAVADVIELVNGQETFVSLSNTGAGNTYTYSAPGGDGATDNGGWIWAGGSRTGIYSTPVVFGSSGDPAHLSGTGLIAVGFCGGFGSTWKDGWVYVFDFTNTDASAFSGKFSLVNEWNNDATARLSGASWSNVEYLFGGVSREKNWAVATRGYGNAYRGADTLELQGATTLAGISGVSEGYGYGSVSDINAKESLTTNAASAELTLTGAGEYAFYGSVGDSAHQIGIVKAGAGTQTFGGAAKYLSSVSVSAGTLELTGGSVVISGEAAVAGGAKLNLSGADVTLASAVSNSGTVTVNSSTVPTTKAGMLSVGTCSRVRISVMRTVRIFPGVLLLMFQQPAP